MLKKVSQIVLIFGIAFSLSACTETKDSNESKQEDVQDKVYKIGETVDVDGLQVTIDSVKLGYLDYDEDKKKEEILGVIFKVENNSKKEIPFAFYEFEITDKKGTRFKEYNNPDSFISKKLAPDEKIQDIMLFDVAKENTYIATYRPEFTRENRTIKFELKPNK
ncbi:MULTISPECIES: DUF4352 domain-containing protein [Bacillus]|uniref:DUF4352 domain-containing protein n=3 Tax=Bacillus thuringiensis TaxID=1428 RepID=A0A1W6WGU5_BACTU|nr:MULTISPECIES: DUF4352 domain-containing protein [Bacillus]MEC2874082.1 DUF4352 domain-containing protein [Bacillus cereus]AEA13997.1 hypothetical protein CT43_CH0304 [Bacillus thuringiensis serovar chinensis CT-43]AFV16114.1 hypothetical protein BTB_c03770 [Bacillus thuringiensis Bt407]AGF99018.1 hypothetical protein H175_ch0305 [Bacillus thuringiensis serovar thuringiensis str. IS5056]ARP55776.1 hypothetical protein CAB88_01035 [Bacillus thuringiensis]